MRVRHGAQRIEQGRRCLFDGQILKSVARQISIGFTGSTARVAHP
jgi:hypothetical protein